MFLFTALIWYLLWGSGIHSDDLEAWARPPIPWDEVLFPEEGKIATPVLYYTHQIFLINSLTHNLAWVEILKAAYISFCFWGLAAMLTIFFPAQIAAIGAFLILFYPSHEASTFWFIGQHTTLSLGFYAWAFAMVWQGRYKLGTVGAGLGSWISYGSTPFAFAFGFWFLLQKKWKEAMCLVLPNLGYILYFFVLTVCLKTGTSRISDDLSFHNFFKRFLLQSISCLDASAGISFFLKTCSSLKEAGFLNILLSLLLALIFLFFLKRDKTSYSSSKIQQLAFLHKKNMLMCLWFMLILAFCMFSFVGLYPQTAFNLGNRAGLYGSIIVSWFLLCWSQKRPLRLFFVLFLILSSSLGLSHHWKTWWQEQKQLFERFKEWHLDESITHNEMFFTTGYRYSRLGWFDHIEGASEPWVARAYLRLGSGLNNPVLPLSRHLQITNKKIIDQKYKTEISLPPKIRILDLSSGQQIFGDCEILRKKINELKPDRRHWFQWLPISWTQKIILPLMPRIEYIYH